MDNLFSFLGNFSDYHFLNKDNKNIIENLSPGNLLRWSDISFEDKKVTVNNIIKKVEDACQIFSIKIFNNNYYFNYNTVGNNDTNTIIKLILKTFNDDFNCLVIPTLKDEMAFIMIANYEYSRSLYHIKINNGTFSNPSKYISVFDKKNREVKKLIEYSVKKFNETDQNKIFQNNKNTFNKLCFRPSIVLPQFIHRFYDKKSLKKRQPIMQSIYDIGPVMGLIGCSTNRKNPYLFNIEKEKNEQFKHKSISLVQSFLNSFDCIPYSINKNNDLLMISSIDALQECKDIAEKEQLIKYKNSSIDFFNSINAEELSVFGQFITERLVHGCFLSKAYNIQFCLQNNIYINYYLNQIINKLILLPLPRTRIKILNCLENFIKRYIINNRSISPSLLFIALDNLTEELKNIINFWIEIALPIRIICYNFLCSNNKLEPDAKYYFEFIYDKYQFYEIKKDGNIDISDSMDLIPIKSCVSQIGNKFDNYSLNLYHYFLLNSYKYAFDFNFSNQLPKFKNMMKKYFMDLMYYSYTNI